LQLQSLSNSPCPSSRSFTAAAPAHAATVASNGAGRKHPIHLSLPLLAVASEERSMSCSLVTARGSWED
jgi:hypothetical protein